VSARITTVKKARKDQGECGRCHTPLPAGSAYRWWKFRYGGTHKRCMANACYPKRSELTQNEVEAMAWDIQDTTVGPVIDFEEFEELVDDFAEQIDELVDLIREKMDNIEAGFGHTSVPAYEELEERAYEAEDWADNVRGVLNDIDEDNFNPEDAVSALEEALAEGSF
jgi:hypothetical protein